MLRQIDANKEERATLSRFALLRRRRSVRDGERGERDALAITAGTECSVARWHERRQSAKTQKRRVNVVRYDIAMIRR